MTSITRILALIILFSPLSALAQVQNANEIVVEKSKEKTIIAGKTYYLHTVKKGENIYRISRAYGVTQKDIIYANPDAMSGIKDGQILKIPTEPNAPRNIQQIESDKYIFHIVEEGQTLYHLTQQYKISKEELIRHNPELEVSPLQVGQVVRIPKNPNAPVETDKVNNTPNYEEHKVKRKETKYSIAKDFNITVDELIAANPILNTEDLQIGQTIRIPLKAKPVTTTVVTQPATSVVTTPLNVKKDSIPRTPIATKPVMDTATIKAPVNIKPCGTYMPFSETYNVALLLPLYIEENETITMVDSANTAKDGEKRSIENSEIFQRTANIIEFYQGALIAIDSLKKTGMSLKVYTYDTGKDMQKISNILSKPEMSKMDLIIGPFFTESVEKVAQFALKNHIKLVSPVSINSNVLKNNPTIFQIIPNDSINADAMLKYIGTLDKKNIILVNSNKYADRELVDLYRKKLTINFPGNFKEYVYKANDTQPNFFTVGNVDNIIIVPSGDIVFINDIVSLLNIAAKTASVKVFGMPVWTMFRNIRQDYFHNLEFHYYTSFYTDFNKPYVKNFLLKYRKEYNSEPYYHSGEHYPYTFTKEGFNFAFLGYDVAFYFLQSMSRLGKDFENCLDYQKYDLLHSNFNFQRLNPTSGFINKGVNILEYTKDISVIKVYPNPY